MELHKNRQGRFVPKISLMCNNNMLELKKKMDVDSGRTINTTVAVGEHLHMTVGVDGALCHKFTQC